jgi:hypothetical protein
MKVPLALRESQRSTRGYVFSPGGHTHWQRRYRDVIDREDLLSGVNRSCRYRLRLQIERSLRDPTCFQPFLGKYRGLGALHDEVDHAAYMLTG